MARFLGMFGPQGALPLTTTEESVPLAVGARRRISALRRHLPAPVPRAVLPRLGGRAPDRAKRPARRGPVSRLYRLDDRRRHAGRSATPTRMSDFAKLEFAGLLAPRVKSASRLRVVSVRLLADARRDRGIRRRLADARSGRTDAARRAPTAAWASTASRAPACSASATSSASASSCATSSISGSSCRARRSRRKSPTRSSSMSARNTTGTWSSRSPPARSRRFGSGESAQARLDELDGAELVQDRRDDPHGRAVSCRQPPRRASAGGEDELARGRPWAQTSASNRSPASSTASATRLSC